MTESGNFSEPPPPTSYLNSENPTSADNRLSNGPYGLFRFYFFLPFRPETSRARIQTTRCGGLALESSLITTVKSNRNFLVNGARFPSLLVKTLPWASTISSWTTTFTSLRLILKQAVNMQQMAVNSQTVLCEGKDLNVMTTTEKVVNSAIPDPTSCQAWKEAG